MSLEVASALSGVNKFQGAIHRKWGCAVVTDGAVWPLAFGSSVASSSDLFRLGTIPTYALVAPSTTSSGTSTAGIYGIALVYRTSKFDDGLIGDDVQSNRSNIVDVTLTSAQAAVLTKVTTTDGKVDLLDVYAAVKTSGAYGTFYRVVKDGANTAGTITFNIQFSSGYLIGAGVTGGTADTAAEVLATDNDYPYTQPLCLEVGGRLVMAGNYVLGNTGSFTNANGTVTLTDTVYTGVEFWYLRRDGDTTGGIDGRGTYLCRYASSTTVTLANADGTADTYEGTTGSGSVIMWTEPNRRYSKLLNPHAFPSDNVNNDYPSAILAMGKVPNTYRVLLYGKDWIIAEDYDRLPMVDGLNFLSTEYGCSSPFSVVGARGKLWWLDLGSQRRAILFSDGSNTFPVSTQKIKTLLDRITLDSNGDVWRVKFIHGQYFPNEETIRWGLYLDGNTVANYVLELDLVTGDVRGDPQFYPLRYQDAFTFGTVRGKVYVGQFGWIGGVARLGLDNVSSRYYDWADTTTTLAGSVNTSGNTTTSIAVTAAAFTTSGDGLKGMQCLVWREYAADGTTLTANPTFYHCRISSNTATGLTFNYVETLGIDGTVSAVGSAFATAPSGLGWRFRVGVIQAIIGPKWFTTRDDKTKGTFRELAMVHRGQALLSTEYPVDAYAQQNFDSQPASVQLMVEANDGAQIADTTLFAASFVQPQLDPVAVMGFTIVDNNVNRLTYALNVESIVLEWNEALPQDNAQP